MIAMKIAMKTALQSAAQTVSKCILAITLLIAAPYAASQTVLQPQSQNATSSKFLPGLIKQVAIEGANDVELSQGSIDQVIIEGDTNARNQMELTLADGKLRIRHQNNWKFWNQSRVKIKITVRDLFEASLLGAGDLHVIGLLKVDKLHLRITGAGDVLVDELNTEELRVSISGAGDVKVAGSARYLAVSIAGSGDFMGEKLKAVQGKLSIAGAGDIKAWVTEELSASIAGAGAIDYWGNPPKVKQSIAGVGSVTNRGERPR